MISHYFKIFRINTILKFKCIITWKSNIAHLKILLPLGPSYFFLYLIIWPIYGLFNNHDPNLILMLLVLSFIILVEIYIEKKRMTNMLKELSDLLTSS